MFNRRFVLHELKQAILEVSADLVFLQEVIGTHRSHSENVKSWPDAPQYEFLADSIWQDYAYGRNAVYSEGDHGNAILSKWPIKRWQNIDVSEHRSEQRGILHCEVVVHDRRLHCLCVHFGLLEKFRSQQLGKLQKYIQTHVLDSDPVIVAGDFNDWRHQAKNRFSEPSGFQEVFEELDGRYRKTFPSFMPLLSLDRIYFKNLKPQKILPLDGRLWSKLSDHRPLAASFLF
jgi:endonuclease/exonuclease/phosphatase family metal-dependent hydrolase